MNNLPNLVASVFMLGGSFAFADMSSINKNSWSVFSRFDSFSYSEPAPIDQVIHDMEGNAIQSGDVAFTHNAVEVGARYGKAELSLLQRYDYYMEFTPETADLIYRDKNDLSASPNREYPIELEANHLRAKGIKLAYNFAPLQNLQIKVAASYLQADVLIDGDINGEIVTTTNDLTGELHLDYAYTDDKLFDRQAESPEGKGFALDLYTQWQVSDKLGLDMSLEDVANLITWDRAPYTQARITSNAVNFDENGFLNTTPVLSGIEGYSKHRQRLPLRASLRGTYQVTNTYDALITWKRVAEVDFPRIGVRYKPSPNRFWQAFYDVKTQAIGVGYQSGNLGYVLSMDDAQWSQAHALGLSVQYRIVF